MRTIGIGRSFHLPDAIKVRVWADPIADLVAFDGFLYEIREMSLCVPVRWIVVPVKMCIGMIYYLRYVLRRMVVGDGSGEGRALCMFTECYCRA